MIHILAPLRFARAESENNSLQISNHPAWGTTFSLSTYQSTPVSVSSNTFCAGGFPLANGTWAVFGGNQPVTYAGVAVNDKGANPTGGDPYNDGDGGAAIRLLDPCDGGDGECPWQEGLTMTVSRRMRFVGLIGWCIGEIARPVGSPAREAVHGSEMSIAGLFH